MENNVDSNAVDSDWNTELTSAAFSTAAIAAAAAAADVDDDGDGWNVCDVETRLMTPPCYSYVR